MCKGNKMLRGNTTLFILVTDTKICRYYTKEYRHLLKMKNFYRKKFDYIKT